MEYNISDSDDSDDNDHDYDDDDDDDDALEDEGKEWEKRSTGSMSHQVLELVWKSWADCQKANLSWYCSSQSNF